MDKPLIKKNFQDTSCINPRDTCLKSTNGKLRDIGDLPQMIKNAREQAWDNLKFYNYSITDIEKAASETPWQ